MKIGRVEVGTMLLLVGAILAGGIAVAFGAARVGVPSLVAFLALVRDLVRRFRYIDETIGLILAFASFWIKSNYEEEVMRKQFPDQYPAYRERVRRIIPFVL